MTKLTVKAYVVDLEGVLRSAQTIRSALGHDAEISIEIRVDEIGCDPADFGGLIHAILDRRTEQQEGLKEYDSWQSAPQMSKG